MGSPTRRRRISPSDGQSHSPMGNPARRRRISLGFCRLLRPPHAAKSGSGIPLGIRFFCISGGSSPPMQKKKRQKIPHDVRDFLLVCHADTFRCRFLLANSCAHSNQSHKNDHITTIHVAMEPGTARTTRDIITFSLLLYIVSAKQIEPPVLAARWFYCLDLPYRLIQSTGTMP